MIVEFEIGVFVLCLVVAGWRWGTFARQWMTLHFWGDARMSAYAGALPIVAGLLLYAVLLFWADQWVRNSYVYQVFYFVMGAAWVGMATWLTQALGIGIRDDVLERRNRAAAAALGGAVLAITFCFAGANIGDGPHFGVVIYCAAMATGALLVVWLVLEVTSHISETITVERNLSSGVRLAGVLVAAGLMMGRAVAGDWVSVGATVADFRQFILPLSVLLLAAWTMEMVGRPTSCRRHDLSISQGLLPAVCYVGGAVMYLLWVGWW